MIQPTADRVLVTIVSPPSALVLLEVPDRGALTGRVEAFGGKVPDLAVGDVVVFLRPHGPAPTLAWIRYERDVLARIELGAGPIEEAPERHPEG